ncbi:hypothetical protein [Undibacterium oligocarboniphilum]|uniref:Uncharacterized protein n=1 Tax=Undibacterium oligocarboniphilum TaxID=666702 RepID=A0A850QQ05_9BURK|nr:hypothetical protein [Undibacterium oligocarboniphilum]MBC3871343.1 hypothetical protein [Undibacterium oligocarboniphilum]NVO78840.1 hypothetical protein [Undibacterium oligocarboniphilum]
MYLPWSVVKVGLQQTGGGPVRVAGLPFGGNDTHAYINVLRHYDRIIRKSRSL